MRHPLSGQMFDLCKQRLLLENSTSGEGHIFMFCELARIKDCLFLFLFGLWQPGQTSEIGLGA